MSIFAQRMRELREEFGWTQEEVAEKLSMQRPTIAGYESVSKKRIPRESTLIKIASLYKTSTDYLLGNTDQRGKIENSPNELSKGPKLLLQTIELSDVEAIENIKKTFTYNGKSISDEAAKEILKFSRYQASQG